MSTVSHNRLLSLALVVLLGCSGDPSGPTSGTLSVTINGLPNGSSAAVSVTGPGGYTQSLTASQTISQLTPGTYTVTASGVTVGAAAYSAVPASQTVAVVTSTPASASVTYSTNGGTLALTVNGLGTSKTAAVTVTGPGGYNQPVTSTTTLSGLVAGSYTIAAQNTTASCGATSYTASPATQNASVAVGSTTNATVTYSAPSSGTLNLCIDGLYLTQSAQDYSGSVPLVQGRNGFLRVFVIANRSNTAAPTVRVRYYNSLGVLLDSATITPGGLSVPTAADESSLTYSWNVAVPGSLIQPGLKIQAVVDPDNLIVEANETDNTFPAAGPLAMTVRTVPQVDVTFVPIIQRGNGLTGNVTDANKDSFLQTTQSMHPIATYNAVVHAPYTTSTLDTLQDVNGNSAWTTILAEIEMLRTTEASSRYYYGVAKVSYSSGVAGVAYVSTSSSPEHAAMGWDYMPTGSLVAAHELGHNWSRRHAPCGGPTGLDPNYPYPDGTTGGYGYDMSSGTLKPPTTTDVMGYCNTKWISAYNYKGVLDYFSPPAPIVQGSAATQAVQPTLLVWGHILNGELVLEPAFQVNTRPRLPSQAGPYSLEAKADDGTSLFRFSFAPSEIADAEVSQQNFVFAVPLSAARAAHVASIRLSGHGREAVLSAAAPPASPGAPPAARPQTVEVRRAASGRVGLRWDARAHPMVMVRDAETGQVLSLARGGDAELSTVKRTVDLVLSDGVKSRVERMPVAP